MLKATEPRSLPLVSVAHLNGTCNPCVFFFSPYGCGKGNWCDYCHLWHSRDERPGRPRADRRQRTVREFAVVSEAEVWVEKE